MKTWRDDLKEISDKMKALNKENARLREALEMYKQREELLIIELYGKRCEKYNEDCVVCKQWANHDKWAKKALGIYQTSNDCSLAEEARRKKALECDCNEDWSNPLCSCRKKEARKMKALGVKPPRGWIVTDVADRAEHYRQALLEAADELTPKTQQDVFNLDKEIHKNPSAWCMRLAKKLRISAGEERCAVQGNLIRNEKEAGE